MLVAAPVLAATTQYVTIRNTQYTPKTVTIRQFDTVYWTHVDSDMQHSVTAAPRQAETFDSSPSCPPTCLERGDAFKHTFTRAGTFTYYCRVHCPDNSCAADGMRGTVVVRAAATAAPAPTRGPATPTAVPRPSNAVSVTAPSPSATAAPTPTIEATTASPFESPSASAAAIPRTTKSSGIGLALGLAITGAAIAALGISLLFIRFRRPS